VAGRYAFLCMLSEHLRNDIYALDAPKAAQRPKDTPWCANPPQLQPPSKRRKLDGGQPSGWAIEEPDFVGESVEGSCGPSERDSDIAEPEEVDAWNKRRETGPRCQRKATQRCINFTVFLLMLIGDTSSDPSALSASCNLLVQA
jgi:hypothetical protein